MRNCDRRLGRDSARFTPISFAPIISPASAALRDKARDPFSGSPSSQHEAGDAAGEIEARAGPIDQGDGGENIEGVGHGRKPIHVLNWRSCLEPSAFGFTRIRRTRGSSSSAGDAQGFGGQSKRSPGLRGSRSGQRPRSTAPRKSVTIRLKSAGSSRFTVWPVLGSTHKPALGIARLRKRLVSRQGSSSSPTTSRVGTRIRAKPSLKSKSEARSA